MPPPPDDVQIVPLARLSWRDGADGVVELHDPARDEWARLAPWTRAVMLGLDAGDDLAALAKRVDVDAPRLHRFLQTLAKVGYLELRIPLPATLGEHRVLRELGRGGVGIAYLCEDAHGEPLVVKRAWGFLNPIESAQAALQREADVLARVRSAHIAGGRGSFQHDGRLHVAREYVAGRSVTEAYDGAPEASRVEAMRLARGAAEAMRALHAEGLLLLDYKPGNFFLGDEARRVVLMDVGHAVDAPGGTAKVRAAHGTRGFLPPELAAERRASVATDVWGLGRLLAFVRTGRLFRKGEPTVAEICAGLAPPEADVVASLCAPDPAARPQSVGPALDAIERALTSDR